MAGHIATPYNVWWQTPARQHLELRFPFRVSIQHEDAPLIRIQFPLTNQQDKI